MAADSMLVTVGLKVLGRSSNLRTISGAHESFKMVQISGWLDRAQMLSMQAFWASFMFSMYARKASCAPPHGPSFAVLLSVMLGWHSGSTSRRGSTLPCMVIVLLWGNMGKATTQALQQGQVSLIDAALKAGIKVACTYAWMTCKW